MQYDFVVFFKLRQAMQ